MSEPCALCGGPVNPHDMNAWKEVSGWVGGPRKDSMRLRADTGRYAHDHCVAKAQEGQDPKAANLFDEIPEPPQSPQIEEEDLPFNGII